MSQLYKPVRTYHDESLSKSETKKYLLSIQLSLNGLSFCLLDTDLNKFVALETYRFDGVTDSISLCKHVETLILSHDFLHKPFRKVQVLYETLKTTLIPDPLFDQAEKELYLQFNHVTDQFEQTLFDHLPTVGAHNVYAIPDCIKYKLGKFYQGVKFVHHSSVLIETILRKYKNKVPDKRAFVNVRDNYLDIVVIQAEKLLYYNAFNYRTIDDFLYYILYTFEQLHVNPEEVHLSMTGNIEKRTSLYDLVNSYVRNVSLGERNAVFKYSHVLEDIPVHQFYTLFDISICEL
ncbi:MAG: DUF3822 family protein [Bacteroidales bacterium]|nr:DUF3822 family protein [Bacteroidales bacterium]